ncbi:uncharacterized protein BROUX77_003037 [Berkeleyomyces rouxiae]|uniref:uncharacterized protein n=1 Tax=Berkeleyomyces rouxiae TaxID=2035830 RepID=UPI003B829065
MWTLALKQQAFSRSSWHMVMTAVSIAVTLFTIISNLVLLTAGRHVSGRGTSHESILLSGLALASVGTSFVTSACWDIC